MESKKKEMLWEQLENMKKEITTVSRWFIDTKKAHSWEETMEGLMLETLHRVMLLSIRMQHALLKPEISIKTEEYK